MQGEVVAIDTRTWLVAQILSALLVNNRYGDTDYCVDVAIRLADLTLERMRPLEDRPQKIG